MLYELLYPLRLEAGWLSWLNVLRYIPFRAIAALLTSLFLCFAIYPWFIARLQKRQIGQVIRDDGPRSHFSKAGTPTMGGSLLLLGMIVPTFLWADLSNPFIWCILGVTTAFGAIGFIDDALKLSRRSAHGLRGWHKFLLQCAAAAGAALFLFTWNGFHPDWLAARDTLAFPFAKWSVFGLDLPWWLYVAFAVLVIVGTSNAVNLTDGLDGLAIGPVMIAGSSYLVMTYLAGTTLRLALGERILAVQAYLDIPKIVPAGELTIFCSALVGAGVGFLWYNTFPAQVFMGDVGSLSLGAALGLLAVLTKNEFLSIIICGVFFLETVSVITQVVSFKLTGRRVFQMAPIHHHFELKGWPEPKIIVRFWIIAIMLALVGIGSYKLR
jgi:phospho-N-acetylmuramoyl-pentapeptide-transferase